MRSRPDFTPPSPKLAPMLRSTLSFVEQYGGSWERNTTLRALRRALLRTVWELEGKHTPPEPKAQHAEGRSAQPDAN
jgi:hypothetical protein